MKPASVNNLIEEFNTLSIDEKGFILDLMQKAYVEDKRTALLKRIKKSEEDLKNGRVKRGTVADLRKDLDSDD